MLLSIIAVLILLLLLLSSGAHFPPEANYNAHLTLTRRDPRISKRDVCVLTSFYLKFSKFSLRMVSVDARDVLYILFLAPCIPLGGLALIYRKTRSRQPKVPDRQSDRKRKRGEEAEGERERATILLFLFLRFAHPGLGVCARNALKHCGHESGGIKS